MSFLQYLLALTITGCLAVSCQAVAPVSTTSTDLGPLKELKVEGLVRLDADDDDPWYPTGFSSEEIERKQNEIFRFDINITFNKLSIQSIDQIREFLSIAKIKKWLTLPKEATVLFPSNNECDIRISVNCTGATIKKIEQILNQRVGGKGRIHQFILKKSAKATDNVNVDYSESNKNKGFGYSGFRYPIENPGLSVYPVAMPELDLCAKSTYHN